MSSNRKLKKIKKKKRKLKLSNGSWPIQCYVMMAKIMSSTHISLQIILELKIRYFKILYMNSCLSLMLTGLLTLFKIFHFRKGSLFLFLFLCFFFFPLCLLPSSRLPLPGLHFIILAILTLDFKINSIEPRNGTLFSINICLSEPAMPHYALLRTMVL